jgi:hypothetical protein
MMRQPKQTVEMPVGWKAWKNDEAVFPPFPPTLEIDQTDFHIPHRHDDYG